MQTLSNWPEYVLDMLVLAVMVSVLVTLICRSRHNWWVRYKWLGLAVGLVTAGASLVVKSNLTPHGTLVPLGQSLLVAAFGACLVTLLFMLLPRREDEWRASDEDYYEDEFIEEPLAQPVQATLATAHAADIEATPQQPTMPSDVVAEHQPQSTPSADIDLASMTAADTLSFDHDDLDPRILDESLDLSETEAIYRTLRDQPVVMDLPNSSAWSDLDDTADHSTDFGDSLLPESVNKHPPANDVADTTGALRQAAIEAEILEGEVVRDGSRRSAKTFLNKEARQAAEQVIAAQKQLLQHAHRKNRKLQAVIKDQKQRIERHRQQTEKARNMARNAARAARLAAQRAAVITAPPPRPVSPPTPDTARQRPAKPMRRTPELTKSD